MNKKNKKEKRANSKSTNIFPRFIRELDYSKEIINKRCDWLEKEAGVKIKHLRSFSQPSESTKGNIENLIGMTQVPVGINGPLLIDGDHAKGAFFVPMATTEGALITDYSIGMLLATRAGGVSASVLSNTIHISPVFFVKNLKEAKELIKWVDLNFTKIKKETEKTTRHGKLLAIMPVIAGRRAVFKFCYDSKDAQGLNMINKATNAACMYISNITKKDFYLRSKFSSVKNTAMSNIHRGYGREVFADCIIPKVMLGFLELRHRQFINMLYQAC